MNTDEETPRSDENGNNPFKSGMKVKLKDGDGLLLPIGRRIELRIQKNAVLSIQMALEDGDSLVVEKSDARLIIGERHFPLFNDFKLKNNQLTYDLPVCGVLDQANRALVFRDMKTAKHSYHLDILHRASLGHSQAEVANFFGCVVAVPDPYDPDRMNNGTGGWGGNEGGILEEDAPTNS